MQRRREGKSLAFERERGRREETGRAGVSQRRINIIIFNSALRPVDRLPTTSSLTRFLTWQPDILAWVRVQSPAPIGSLLSSHVPLPFGSVQRRRKQIQCSSALLACPRLLSVSPLLPSIVLLRPTAAHIPSFVARAGVRNGHPSPTHARIDAATLKINNIIMIQR